MKKIFFFHEKLEVGKIVSKYLEVEYTFNTEYSNNIEEAKNKVNAYDYDLVISIDKVKDEEGRTVDSAKDLINVLMDRGLQTKFVVLGDLDIAFGNLEKYKREFKLDDLSRDVIKFLEISKEDLDYIKKPEYLPVSINSFYQLNHPCTDIYIRIKKKDGDQYVKRINADDEIDKEIIKKYEAMNLTEFYIYKDNYQALMTQILNQSINRLVEAHKEDAANIIEISSDTYEISQNMLEDLGISPQTVKLAKTNIKSMMKAVSSDSKLGSLLKDILSNEASYSYKRSYLISLFFNQIMPYLGWGRGDQLSQNLEKITYVSFFHDSFLKDDKLLRIMNTEDLENSDLSDEEKKLVSEHANKAATFIQEFPQCPSGIDVIIKQHHGSRNGVGFPSQLTTSISPMSIAFIVVEDFCTQILERLYTGEKKSIKDIFSELDLRYTLPSYRKTLELLKNVTMKSK